jgi:flavin reductase (DIM6/NTAB) family NADH-FMN oxidoreductase RutF
MFTVFYGRDKTVPLIEECPVVHECRVFKEVEVGTHVLVIGEISETHVNEDCLRENRPVIEKIDPLVYAPGGKQYHALGRMVGKAFSST